MFLQLYRWWVFATPCSDARARGYHAGRKSRFQTPSPSKPDRSTQGSAHAGLSTLPPGEVTPEDLQTRARAYTRTQTHTNKHASQSCIASCRAMDKSAFIIGKNMDHPHLKGRFTLRIWIPVEQVRCGTFCRDRSGTVFRQGKYASTYSVSFLSPEFASVNLETAHTLVSGVTVGGNRERA